MNQLAIANVDVLGLEVEELSSGLQFMEAADYEFVGGGDMVNML